MTHKIITIIRTLGIVLGLFSLWYGTLTFLDTINHELSFGFFVVTVLSGFRFTYIKESVGRFTSFFKNPKFSVEGFTAPRWRKPVAGTIGILFVIGGLITVITVIKAIEDRREIVAQEEADFDLDEWLKEASRRPRETQLRGMKEIAPLLISKLEGTFGTCKLADEELVREWPDLKMGDMVLLPASLDSAGHINFTEFLHSMDVGYGLTREEQNLHSLLKRLNLPVDYSNVSCDHWIPILREVATKE